MSQFSSVPARGMRDVTPKEVTLRNYVKSVILDTYKAYGFEQIETPSLENIDLLTNGDGGENVHLIYKVLKRGKKLNLNQSPITELDLTDLGLRFDLTVPLVRFYANHLSSLNYPFKSIQMGDVWRAERPQRGRYRQFVQCDIDIIGEESCLGETQLILAASEVLNKLEFKSFTIRLNDRRILQQLAKSTGFPPETHDNLFIIVDKIDKIGFDGVIEECIHKGFEPSKVDQFFTYMQDLMDSTIPINELLRKLPNSIDRSVLQDLQTVVEVVREQANATVVYDPTLVRGMSYYTGQIYEFVSEGFAGSLVGGGRYDDMLGRFLKESKPACGISIGFERIISLLEEQGFKAPTESKKLAYLYEKQDTESIRVQLENTNAIRANGYIVSLIPKRKNMRAQLDQLTKNGFSYFCVHGEKLEIKPIQ
jgi:histidyl-tRNA synthetase